MRTLTEVGEFLFKDLADPRVYHWPLMSNPYSLLAILFVYLCLIYIILPLYMENRKPFVLKRFIMAYNCVQILGCSMIFHGLLTSGWSTHYTFGCQLVDYSNDKMALRIAGFLWWATIFRLVDLIETVLFVLRKKHNQVSFLHVYHHVFTAIMGWLLLKYTAGGMSSFCGLLNNAVHVLMYTYYLLASLGPGMQKKLEVVKSKLTLVQITHMTVIMIHSAQVLLPGCEYSYLLPFIMIPHICMNLYFFTKFYVSNYMKKKEATKGH